MRKLIAAVLLLGISAPAMAQEDGLKAWEKISAVFSHPRCASNDDSWRQSQPQCAGLRADVCLFR